MTDSGLEAPSGRPGDCVPSPDVAATDDTHCPRCGGYMPMTLDGAKRVHDCDRTPPMDGLPPTVRACPVCGGHGIFAWGCWGTEEHPHEHAYMRPVHELVRERAALVAKPAGTGPEPKAEPDKPEQPLGGVTDER